jgi:DNA-binding LytR/AlgR family response regulator
VSRLQRSSQEVSYCPATFEKSVALKSIGLKTLTKTENAMNNPTPSSPLPEGRIVIADKGVQYIISLNAILLLEACRTYTVVRMKDGRTHVSSKNLKRIEQEIESPCFFRIHRSQLLNLYEVKSITRGRGLILELSDKTQVRVSLRKKALFMEAILNLNIHDRRAS